LCSRKLLPTTTCQEEPKDEDRKTGLAVSQVLLRLENQEISDPWWVWQQSLLCRKLLSTTTCQEEPKDEDRKTGLVVSQVLLWLENQEISDPWWVWQHSNAVML
jgi:hypothetical protein